MSYSNDESPINPLPPVVVALSILIFGIEVVFQAGVRGLLGGPEAVGWRLNAIQDYAYSEVIFSWMLETGRWQLEHLQRFVTYPFVHYSFTHTLMVLVFLLALGKMVGEVFGTMGVLLVFFNSAITGALAYTILLNDPQPLVGGYPAVYGLIGCYTFLLWINEAASGGNQLRAFTLIGFLMGIQLLFGLLFGSSNDWVADLFGFIAGFLVSFLLVPGAMRRIRDKLRQR